MRAIAASRMRHCPQTRGAPQKAGTGEPARGEGQATARCR